MSDQDQIDKVVGVINPEVAKVLGPIITGTHKALSEIRQRLWAAQEARARVAREYEAAGEQVAYLEREYRAYAEALNSQWEQLNRELQSVPKQNDARVTLKVDADSATDDPNQAEATKGDPA